MILLPLTNNIWPTGCIIINTLSVETFMMKMKVMHQCINAFSTSAFKLQTYYVSRRVVHVGMNILKLSNIK